MSWVTNTLIHVGIADEYLLSKVNEFFPDGIRGFVSLDDSALPSGWYGGSKYLEVVVGVGAFNHLDVAELVRHIKTIKWAEPESVQLLICDQEDYGFKVLDLFPEAQAAFDGELK